MSKKKQAKTHHPAPSQGTDLLNNSYVHYFLLFTGSLLLYGWTTSFEFGLDDDYILTYLSQTENSFSGLIAVFKQWYAGADYRPVTMLSFWIERLFFQGIHPSTAHLVNVMLFGLLLISIYQLVIASKFLEDEKALKMLALLTALIFLVHPNHVSVVANVKSRDNILSMLFGVLGAIQLLKVYDLRQYYRIFLFIFFTVLGLLSKLDAYSLIFYPALVILFFRSITKRQIGIVFITTGILFLVSFGISQFFKTRLLDEQMHNFVFGIAESPIDANAPFLQRLSLSLTTMLYYLKFLFIPFGYYFYYGYNQIPLTSLFSILNIISAVIYLGLLAASIYYFHKNRIWLFCILYFGISIAYAMNLFMPIAGIIMDRYNFIPSLAFCIALSSLFITLFNTPSQQYLKNKWIIGFLLVSAGFTIYRATAWKNSFTLFDRDLPYLTHSVNANRIAGGTYIHLALREEMKDHYDRNLTDSFITKGERYAKIALLTSPRTSQVWELLGLCDLYRKNDSSALEKFKKCYETDTTYLSGINYLGFTYWNLNQIDSAYYYFSYVVNREPIFNYSANNLINLLIKNNRRREADSILSVLSKRYPNDPRLINKIQEVNQNTTVPFIPK